MKVNTYYGSIWDELPRTCLPCQGEVAAGRRGRIPQSQEEAEKLHEAAESSMHDSLMKAIDSHNESVRKESELRRKTQQKKDIERRVIQSREQHRVMLEKDAVRRKRNTEIFA